MPGYDSWKTRSPDDDLEGPEQPTHEQEEADYMDGQQQRDHLDKRWCCFNCNKTMRVGEMKLGSLTSFICPHCDSDNTHPAEGVVELDEYHGDIGTRN